MKLDELVVYQLYPKSFKDSNGDGIGDLPGIISELDYLEGLGIDMIWLNPFYPSPQNDNGYDVSDYCAIDPVFGSMDDFEELVDQAQKRGIGLMLDMVFNHTSTDHEWFQRALAGEKKYQDYYYLRPAKEDGSRPTNWASKFGGPAWSPFGGTDLYYLHLYDVTQADLNWHNPEVRQELYKIVNFWLDKGVKGFRFDVLNVIGKDPVLVDSEEPGSDQEKSLYTDTPIVHEWIHEMNAQTFGQWEDIITVGEMSSTTLENGIRYTNPEEDELSMIFNFHHLKVDYKDGDKWSQMPFDFLELKSILDHWQSGMSQGNGWNALFLNNHDQPRSNSRFGDVDKHAYRTSTMLATAIQLLRGTPYIYQGEEIGMTNPGYTSIDQYDDIESHNNYRLLIEAGKTEEEALAILGEKSRDNSRTPMQWNNQPHAGFTTGTPWLEVADNYSTINVEQAQVGQTIFRYYQQLIHLRKSHPTLRQGAYRGFWLEDPNLFAYIREDDQSQVLVISNFYDQDLTFDLPEEFQGRQSQRLLGNGQAFVKHGSLKMGPYETVVLEFDRH